MSGKNVGLQIQAEKSSGKDMSEDGGSRKFPIIHYQLLGCPALDFGWRSYGIHENLFVVIRKMNRHREILPNMLSWKIVRRRFSKGMWVNEEVVWQSNPDSIFTD